MLLLLWGEEALFVRRSAAAEKAARVAIGTRPAAEADDDEAETADALRITAARMIK
jgi:hypothetical protein